MQNHNILVVKRFLFFSFLASGDSFYSLATSLRVGTSTVQGIVRETCKALWDVLQPLVMPTPNEDKWKKIAEKFWQMCKFPLCVGAIDGKHVALKAPNNARSTFYDYKGYHSLVLMAIVDADLNFVIVHVGANGRNSDGGVLKQSCFGRALDNGLLMLPEDNVLPNRSANSPKMPYVFIGDEAFPLKRNLMRPFGGRQLTEEKRVFNFRLSSARRCVENAFGILAARWRLLRKPIECQPEAVEDYVKAMCVLHNYLGASTQQSTSTNPSTLQSISNRVTNSSSAAQSIRDQLTQYFLTDGEVTWQLDYANQGTF